jgi:arginine deiminase
LEQHVKGLLVGDSDSFELAGVKLSVKKVAELMELPDLSGVNALIDQANEAKVELWQIPFSKIRNDKNIELDSVWLSAKLDSFTVYAENEDQAATFFVFTELVKNINKLVENRSQKQYFEFLEMENLLKWEDTQFIIETKDSSLRRLFHLFGANEAAINRREAKGLKFSGSL